MSSGSLVRVLLVGGVILALGGCARERAEAGATAAPAVVGPVELAGTSPWRVLANAGGGEGPGSLSVGWQGLPVTVGRPGAVVQVGTVPLDQVGGSWLPPRGTGERMHLRFLGSALSPELDHWFRDVFRRHDEVRVVDDLTFVLGRRAPVAVTWWLARAADLQSVANDDANGRWRLRWAGVELEIQASRGTVAEIVPGTDGTVRLTLSSPADATAFKLLQIFRVAPPDAPGDAATPL